jgi:hypothetical protein
MKKSFAVICTATLVLAIYSCEKDEPSREIISFEELDPGEDGIWNGSDGSGGFTSGNAFFPVDFNAEWDSWRGFAYSNHRDTQTPGYGNQYSCYAGGGANRSDVFALVFDGDTITFTVPETLEKISVANSTYAALSMKEGDDYAKKFGGEDGSDPDFFHLIITGLDESGEVTGTMKVALADFTYDDPAEDYISNAWSEVPLEFMGTVKRLAFAFDSSDKGDWGINTPRYACIDNITGILP